MAVRMMGEMKRNGETTFYDTVLSAQSGPSKLECIALMNDDEGL